MNLEGVLGALSKDAVSVLLTSLFVAVDIFLAHSLKLVDAAAGIAVTFPVGCVSCRLMRSSVVDGDYITN